MAAPLAFPNPAGLAEGPQPLDPQALALGPTITDGRVVPIRAMKINEVLDAALAEAPAARRVTPGHLDL